MFQLHRFFTVSALVISVGRVPPYAGVSSQGTVHAASFPTGRSGMSAAASSPLIQQPDPHSVVVQVTQNESRAARSKPPELYTSDERSDRTSGHLWEERIAETDAGKLRRLVAEDGRPLPQDREANEIARLRTIASNPASFIATEKAKKDDEQHAREMLDLLPRAFLFERLPDEGPWLRFRFTPDPAFVPGTFEERVLHGMSGDLVVDRNQLRLHHLEGRLSKDVSFGLGLLAVIRSGSSFSLTRDPIANGVWKTSEVDTDIQGRAILFKTIARRQRTIHKDFVPLAANASIASAVDRLLH